MTRVLSAHLVYRWGQFKRRSDVTIEASRMIELAGFDRALAEMNRIADALGAIEAVLRLDYGDGDPPTEVRIQTAGPIAKRLRFDTVAKTAQNRPN
jgi:hypothetical protein